jgi:hypothetical protein
VDGGGRTGEVEDGVHLQVDGRDDVVADQLEEGVAQEVANILFGAGEVVIEAEDLVTFGQQPFAEVRADEARPAGHQHARHRQVSRPLPLGTGREAGRYPSRIVRECPMTNSQ